MKSSFIFRILGALICWGAVAFLASDMSALYEEELLWGKRPFWAMVATWGGVLLLWGHKISSLPNATKLTAASVSTGVMLGAGFSWMPAFPLFFVAFVPLFWAEHSVSEQRGKASKWTVFKLAFNAFFIWNILATSWVLNAGLIAGVIANVLNSVFMALTFMLYHVFKQYHDRRLAGLIFIAVWFTFEWWHMYWEISWPWLTLGNGFAQVPSLVQWYEYTGVFGGGLWMLWVNVLIADALYTNLDEAKDSGEPVVVSSILRTMGLKPFAILFLPMIGSLVLYYTYTEQGYKDVEVVSLQPNLEPHYVKFSTSSDGQLEDMLALAEGMDLSKTDYLVFPETSVRGLFKLNNALIGEPLNPKETRLRAFAANYPQLNLVFGVTSAKKYEEFPMPKTVRKHGCRKDENGNLVDCQYIEYHNAAILMNNASDTIQIYKKSKLVPGAESMPYIGNIDAFNDLIMDLGGASGLGLGKQEYRSALVAADYGRVGSLICYESVYGDFVKNYVRQGGAEAFFVITNDGWWDNTLGHRQHLHYASLRAIENRRAVVRSANTGISAFINQRGDIVQSSQYDEKIALKGSIKMNRAVTVYSQFGDLIGRIGLMLGILFFLSTTVKSLRGGINAKKKPGDKI